MATGKQINELTQAGSVGASDVVAIAQSGNTEATKASMTQLAQAIGEINESGALSELVYATSQGKALLAQYITGKGIPTSASETLIQMADKVNSMTLDGNSERIYADAVGQTVTSTTGINTSVDYFVNPLNLDYVIITTNILYYVPYSESYDSFDDMLNAATHTLNLKELDASYDYNSLGISYRYASNMSEDFSKLVLPVTVNSATATALVFDVNPENGFTLLHTISSKTLNQASSSNWIGVQWGISDTGNHLFYSTSNNTYIYDIVNATDYALGSSIATYSSTTLMKPHAIYIIQGGSSATSYNYLKKLPYTIDSSTGAVTFGTLITSDYVYTGNARNISRSCWLHVPGQSDEPVLATAGASYYTPDNSSYSTIRIPLYAMKVSTLRLSEDDTQDNKTYNFMNFLQATTTASAISTVSIAYLRVMFNPGMWKIVSYDDDTITYYSYIIDGEFTLNRHTGELNIPTPRKTIIMYATWDNNSGIGNAFYTNKSVALVCNTGSTTYSNHFLSINSTYRRVEYSHEHTYLVGFKTMPNSENTEYYMLLIVNADHNLTYADPYIVETTITPSVPDEA